MTNNQAEKMISKLDEILGVLKSIVTNTNPPYLCPSVWINDYPQSGEDSGQWDGNNPYVTICCCGCIPCMCTTTGEDAGEKA
jgi:hypothetical protein